MLYVKEWNSILFLACPIMKVRSYTALTSITDLRFPNQKDVKLELLWTMKYISHRLCKVFVKKIMHFHLKRG